MKTKKLIPFILWPLLSSPTLNIITGASYSEINSVVSNISDNGNIIYSERVTNNLIYLYDGIKREIPLCQEAVKIKDKLFVYNIRFPFITLSDTYITKYLGFECQAQKDYIGMIHNHPSLGECEFSDVDNERFRRDHNAKIETIVCFANIEKDSLVIKTKVKK